MPSEARVGARELAHAFCGTNHLLRCPTNSHGYSCNELTDAIEARDAQNAEERPYDKGYVVELHSQIENMRPVVHGLERENDALKTECDRLAGELAQRVAERDDAFVLASKAATDRSSALADLEHSEAVRADLSWALGENRNASEAESRRLSIRLEAAEGLLRERSGTYRTCEGNWVFEGDSIYVRTGETRLLGRVFDQHRCDAGDPEKCWEHRRRRFLATSPASAETTGKETT